MYLEIIKDGKSNRLDLGYMYKGKFYMLRHDDPSMYKFLYTTEIEKQFLESRRCLSFEEYKEVVKDSSNKAEVAKVETEVKPEVVNIPQVDPPIAPPVRRGRGRPRKYPLPQPVVQETPVDPQVEKVNEGVKETADIIKIEASADVVSDESTKVTSEDIVESVQI